MEQQAKDHTCDAYNLIEPKEENMLEDLEVADEGDDDKDFIMPKEELSNSSPHLEQWNDQQVSMLMPIKIKTILSKEIVELQKVFKSSEDTEVSARCLRTHINLEPTESYLLHASLPTDGAQTLGARLPMIHTTGKDKAVHQTWGTEASTQDTEHMYTAGPGVLCPQPELGCSQLTPTAVLNVGQKDGAASQSSNLSNKTMVFITERASHPSRAQIESLLEYLERNPSLAKGFSKVPCARDAARRSWEALALQLNSLGGCVKSSKQWTKYWADKKSAVKKKGALRYRAPNKTGGEAEAVELNELEEKILLIMGGESFATGHRHLEINPFENQSALPVPPPSPPHTPPAGVSGPRPLPTTPSGSGAHPSRRTMKKGSPAQKQPPSSMTTPSNRRGRQRRKTVAPPTQRRSPFSRMTERFLAIEEQRMEVARRSSLLLEAMVDRAHERDVATSQALQAIGEGTRRRPRPATDASCSQRAAHVRGVCQSTCAGPSALAHHMRTHTGEGPFPCTLCQKTFSRKAYLTKHAWTHTVHVVVRGRQPASCSQRAAHVRGVCQSTCAGPSALARHMRTHTGEGPFPCTLCQKTFSRKAYLTKHAWTHTASAQAQRDLATKAKLNSFANFYGEEIALLLHNIQKQAGEALLVPAVRREVHAQA